MGQRLPRLAIVLSVVMSVGSAIAGEPSKLELRLPHDPAHAEDPSHWCAVHMARGELVQAMSDCDYAVSIAPQDVKALSNRGSVWLFAGDPGQAISDFNAAISINPADANLFYNRGIAKARLGMSQESIADYSAAIDKDPRLAIAHHNRGVEYEKLKNLAEAAKDYMRALELSPGLKPATDGLRRLNSGRL